MHDILKKLKKERKHQISAYTASSVDLKRSRFNLHLMQHGGEKINKIKYIPYLTYFFLAYKHIFCLGLMHKSFDRVYMCLTDLSSEAVLARLLVSSVAVMILPVSWLVPSCSDQTHLSCIPETGPAASPL